MDALSTDQESQAYRGGRRWLMPPQDDTSADLASVRQARWPLEVVLPVVPL